MLLPYTAAEVAKMTKDWHRNEALKAHHARLRDHEKTAAAIAKQRCKDSKDIRDDIKRGMM